MRKVRNTCSIIEKPFLRDEVYLIMIFNKNNPIACYKTLNLSNLLEFALFTYLQLQKKKASSEKPTHQYAVRPSLDNKNK